MKIICALAVSITVESLDGIIFYSLFSTLGIFADLKKPQKITLSTMENHIHGKKKSNSETRNKIVYSISAYFFAAKSSLVRLCNMRLMTYPII